MPYLYISTSEQKEYEYIAKELVGELASIINAPVSDFNFIYNSKEILCDGTSVKDKVIISYQGYPRTAEQYKMMSKLLIESLHKKFNKNADVFFLKIDSEAYFETINFIKK